LEIRLARLSLQALPQYARPLLKEVKKSLADCRLSAETTEMLQKKIDRLEHAIIKAEKKRSG